MSKEPVVSRLTPEQLAYITQVEKVWRERVIALALPDEQHEQDAIFSWETAESMASQGRSILVLEADGWLSADDLQAMCDRSKAAYEDCFGIKEGGTDADHAV